MDAKAFISQKYSAAVDDLRALDAEYMRRKAAAQAVIDLTQGWLWELGAEVVKSEPMHARVEMVDPISERLAQLKVAQNSSNEVVLDRTVLEAKMVNSETEPQLAQGVVEIKMVEIAPAIKMLQAEPEAKIVQVAVPEAKVVQIVEPKLIVQSEPEPKVVQADGVKRPLETWISARDLRPNIRRAS